MGSLFGGDNFRIPRKNVKGAQKSQYNRKGREKGTTDHDFQNKTKTQSPKDIKKKKTRNHHDKPELPEQV